jgi:competence protein ComEC
LWGSLSESLLPVTIICMSLPADLPAHRETDLPHYQPLMIVLAAVCAGIVADYYWPQTITTWLLAGLVSLGLWHLPARRGHPRAAAVLLMLSLWGIGAAGHHLRWNLFNENDLGNYTQAKAQPIALEAIVLNAPRLVLPSAPNAPPGYRMEISAQAVRDGSEWKTVSGRAMLFVHNGMPPVEAGDRIRVFGSLSNTTVACNPGEFDWAAYLRRHRVRAHLDADTAACVSIIQTGSSWNLTRWLESVRSRGSELFRQYLDPRQAELASAVLLGEREQIDRDRNEAFMTTGTVHVLAISGLHVGILAGALLWIMWRVPLPRAWGLALVALITTLYALMVDVNPPVVRATILVWIVCLALCLGRETLSFNSLAAAALVVLAINPAELFNVGAQLSFLSVAALMWLWHHWTIKNRDKERLRQMALEQMNPLSRFLGRFYDKVRNIAVAGCVIWVVTQPLVAARFHIFSPIALVLNAVLWVPMTLALLSGFAFLFIAVVVPPLAGAAAFCCNLNLWLLEKGVDFAAALPGSHFWVPGPENWWLAGFYGGVIVLAAVPKVRPKLRWCLALLVAWAGLGFAVSWARHDSDRLHCTFLSVGHGCAVVMELPSGQTLLYDAGRFGAPAHAARIITGFLWSRGITRIDTVVLSHADVDHYNALPEVLEKCAVGKVYVSPMMFANDTPALRELKSALRRAKVQVRETIAGDRLQDEANCHIEVIHPSRQGSPDNDNANSLVLLVECFGRRVLLPGDLESPGLDDLLAQQPVQCDVLLAPHHGSRKSNSPGLAAWCRPAWVVFSGDERWSLPEIDATYQAVGSRTLHTFLSGAVEVSIDQRGASVETFLQDKQNDKEIR